LDLPTVENGFVKVYINDVFFGMYYLEEKYDEDYLEKNGLPNNLIIEFDTSKVKNRGVFDTSTISIDSISDNLSFDKQLIVDRAYELFESIENSNKERLISLLDLDKVSSFEELSF